MTLRGGVRHYNPTDDWAFVAGLAIPIPVFDRNQGATLEAKYRLAKAEERRRALQVHVQTALVRIYQRLTTARSEAISLKSDVLPGARSAFEATGEGVAPPTAGVEFDWVGGIITIVIVLVILGIVYRILVFRGILPLGKK